MTAQQDIAVELEKRDVVRKGLRKLRMDGQVPAVIHDHGKESIHVMGNYAKLAKVFQEAGKHHPVQLSIGSEHHLALIKDVDFEPVRRRMRHVVFQAIKQDEKVEAEVPIVYAEVDIPAEKLSLLVLKQLDHVQVEALPKNLPNELVVDPSKLTDVGDNLTVADLQVPEGVTILSDPEAQIAIVEIPKDQLAEADAMAAALEADKAESEAPEVEAEHGEEEATEETPASEETPNS